MEKLPDGTDLSKYVAPGYSYNKEEAAKLFKEGLAEAGLSDLKLTITADSDSPVSKAAVDYIKETWEKALPGLTVEEKFVTFKQRLEDTKNQNFDVALVLWGGDYQKDQHSIACSLQIPLITMVRQIALHMTQPMKKLFQRMH